jgi:hypothetical protein
MSSGNRLKFCAVVFINLSDHKVNQSRQGDYNAVAGFFSPAVGEARITQFEGLSKSGREGGQGLNCWRHRVVGNQAPGI